MEAAIDFSIWALFSRATLPVQAVIVLLIGLSIWSWTIAINKRIALNLARRRSAKFCRKTGWLARLSQSHNRHFGAKKHLPSALHFLVQDPPGRSR